MTTTTDIDMSEPPLTELAARVDVAPSPLDKLQALRDLDTALKRAMPTVVAQARAEGATNADVGRHLGVSRQAVAKRFPRDARASDADGEGRTSEEGRPRPPIDRSSAPRFASQPVFEVTTSRGRVIARVNRLGRLVR